MLIITFKKNGVGVSVPQLTLHVKDLVHGFRAVTSITPQWTSGLNSRSEATDMRVKSQGSSLKEAQFWFFCPLTCDFLVKVASATAAAAAVLLLVRED